MPHTVCRGAQSLSVSPLSPRPLIYVYSSLPVPKTDPLGVPKTIRLTGEVHTLTSTTPKLALALSLTRHTTLQFRTTSLSRDEHAPVTERSAVYEPRRSPAPGKRVGTERAHFGADRSG